MPQTHVLMQLPDVPILARASDAYKTARSALFTEERALLDHVERVAAQRRSLPTGPTVDDYSFEKSDGTTQRLSRLFEDKEVLLAYNLMYGPQDDAPCPMCTRWIDGFNALAPRVQDTAPFVVFARAPASRLDALSRSRSWSIPLYSAQQAYSREVGAETADGDQMPLVTVFRKDRTGPMMLWYSQCAVFPDGSNRGIDLLNPLWGLLDLLPMGRGEYVPPAVVL